MSERIVGIGIDRLLEPLECDLKAFVPVGQSPTSTEFAVIGREVARWFASNMLNREAVEMAGNSTHDGTNDFILHREYVVQIAVVSLSPNVIPGFGLDELCSNPHPVGHLTHATLHDVMDAQFTADLLNLRRLTLVLK